MDWSLVAILTFVLALVSLRMFAPAIRARGPNAALPAADQAALERALEQARRLEERVDSLERVLDDDMPGWRRRVSA